jgi:hypothetical protein
MFSELRPAIATRLRCAARPHDLGRAEVSADVWGWPGPLSIADMERVRMHTYWSRRVRERVPTPAPSAPAAAHHERLDGSNYHRGDFEIRFSPTARLLIAARVYAAPTEPRPHRNACTVDEAVGQLTCEADFGTLDRAACGLVLRAAGGRPSRPRCPAGLMAREVEVLRQAIDGLTSHQAGAELSLPSRTLGHRLGYVCEKTERRTRAGVAVFAVEQPTGSTSARLSSAPPLAMPEPITCRVLTAHAGDRPASSTTRPYGTEVGRYSPPRTAGGAAPHDSQGRGRRVVCRSRRLFPG